MISCSMVRKDYRSGGTNLPDSRSHIPEDCNLNIHYSEKPSPQNVILNSSKLMKTSKLRSSNGCICWMHHFTTTALTL